MSSILLGTVGLLLAAIVALVLTVSRSTVTSNRLRRIRAIAGLGVLLQAAHFGEEYSHQFYVRFPELLGLNSWSEDFFVTFNLFWLVIWVLSIACIGKVPRMAIFPLWFLAIASTANGFIHPMMSVIMGGYFPGLWSSPFVGLLGVVLLLALASATNARGNPHGAT